MPGKKPLVIIVFAVFAVVSALLVPAAPVSAASKYWAASKYRVLHRFAGKDGVGPQASLIFDAAGNLYGTTFIGGDGNNGTVFELVPGAMGKWTEHVLHSFDLYDGSQPGSSLVIGAPGNLYGTTAGGGFYLSGVVFNLAQGPSGQWNESVLHTFRQKDGSPNGVVLDGAGKLYGTTTGYGSYGGTAFKLGLAGKETVLHNFRFNHVRQGTSPQAGLILDKAGNLYGTTAYGGNCSETQSGCGIVFKLAHGPSGKWTETVLHIFNGNDGARPVAPLIFDAAGNLYGTTAYGGIGNSGTVFKLTPGSDGKWTETVLHRFRGRDGVRPVGGLILDATGNLYGTTIEGGNFDCGAGFGTVFQADTQRKRQVGSDCSTCLLWPGWLRPNLQSDLRRGREFVRYNGLRWQLWRLLRN
jgi:uncharacterized repeat protein (TIGR03803 family)